MPPASLRISPARTISLWLINSASEGASLSVARKYREARIAPGQAKRDILLEVIRALSLCDRGFKSPWIYGRMGADKTLAGLHMLDRDGYRPNVGIILCNWRNEVFWGKRVKEHSWQFP